MKSGYTCVWYGTTDKPISNVVVLHISHLIFNIVCLRKKWKNTDIMARFHRQGLD